MKRKINFSKTIEISSYFSSMNVLTKLRIVVGIITILSTLAIVLVFVADFLYPVVLILLSYIVLLILCVKLFLTPHF